MLRYKVFLYVFVCLFFGLFGFYFVSAKTIKCPLVVNSVYKSAGSPTVYFITKNCTKQTFSGPSAFLERFKTWKKVKSTTKTKLSKIAKDKQYILYSKKETTVRKVEKVPEKIVEKITPQCTSSRDFQMVVLIDDSSYKISDEEIANFFSSASQLTYDRACVSIKIISGAILRVNLLSDGSDLNTTVATTLSSHKDLLAQANGFTLLTDVDKTATTFGAHTFFLNLATDYYLPGYCNPFAYKIGYKSILGSIIDWDHRFAQCGYDDQGNHVSDNSFPQECRTRPTKCVLYNGYYMCANSVNDYYASTKSMFAVTSIVHEIMHAFGDNSNYDHYGTDVCKSYPVPKKEFACQTTAGESSFLDESECYISMCPYVYENLKNTPVSCP